ncbi:MAG: hypothetical protein K1X89_24620, partial [Myxococcaceae bacterium]|nr:hypothetical protein [Myxococcaceae bacterium]
VRSGPHGESADELLGAAFDALHPERRAEVLRVDPLAVRLAELVDGLEVPLLGVEGPPGSGRATLGRRWLEARAGRFVEVFAADAAAAAAAWASEAPLLLKGLHPAVVGPRSAPTVVTLSPGEAPERFPVRLAVPGLADRPSEVLELAELFLARARAALGRPRLVLAADARSALGRYGWPGNVRELENAAWLAAYASVRDEVGRDALAAQLTRDAPQDDLRDALVSTERTLLLEALARTRWNVTAAAARLKLPRRTVVYRMKKLGLQRPARHGPARS